LFNRFYIRRPHIPETERLKQFRRVEKYANDAETVSAFYFSFISPCATGLHKKSRRLQPKKADSAFTVLLPMDIKTGGNTGKIDAHLRDTGNTRLSSLK